VIIKGNFRTNFEETKLSQNNVGEISFFRKNGKRNFHLNPMIDQQSPIANTTLFLEKYPLFTTLKQNMISRPDFSVVIVILKMFILMHLNLSKL
jgi:hypothetical protein